MNPEKVPIRTKRLKILPESSWNEPPTTEQLQAIFRAAKILNLELTEPDIPTTRWEARRLQYELWNQVRTKPKSKRR